MKEIKVDIYADEIKERQLIGIDGKSQKWIYIGILIVPLHKKLELFNQLMIRRCGSPNPNNWALCTNECDFHSKNGIEIHYNELRSQSIYFIAKRWTQYFIQDTDNTYFYMLGIETTKINDDFGSVNSFL
jgi:hypothetical protein